MLLLSGAAPPGLENLLGSDTWACSAASAPAIRSTLAPCLISLLAPHQERWAFLPLVRVVGGLGAHGRSACFFLWSPSRHRSFRASTAVGRLVRSLPWCALCPWLLLPLLCSLAHSRQWHGSSAAPTAPLPRRLGCGAHSTLLGSLVCWAGLGTASALRAGRPSTGPSPEALLPWQPGAPQAAGGVGRVSSAHTARLRVPGSRHTASSGVFAALEPGRASEGAGLCGWARVLCGAGPRTAALAA